jgi:hypothetical protein
MTDNNGHCTQCGIDELKLTPREVAQVEAALDGEPAVIQSLAELLRGNPWEKVSAPE